MKYKTKWYAILSMIGYGIGSIRWDFRKKDFKKHQHDILLETIKEGNYLILTKNKYTLSALVVSILSYIKTKEWPDYTHILISFKRENGKVGFVEATKNGVHYSDYKMITDVSNICVIAPISINDKEWQKVLYKVEKQIGKKYDNLFDLNDNERLSCVELVRFSLQALHDYYDNFKCIENKIEKYGNLTPQMFRDSSDFNVILEMKK